MSLNIARMDLVRAYHERSKHHLDRYAPGPGGLDWASQPDPFRRYAGAPELDLPLLTEDLPVCWDELFATAVVPQQAMTAKSLACLLQLSLGLSAWKSYAGNRWALRCNPSSGNLHPTEGYLICPDLPGLPAGVHHYRPDRHCLERRAAAPFAWSGGVLVALTGIHWREAWKYGMRAFRYCQHDCGHALAALSYAAATLGWSVRLLADWGDEQIACITGVDRTDDFLAIEAEAPEALVWIGWGAAPYAAQALAMLAGAEWAGRANALSPDHRNWPDIAVVTAATGKPAGTRVPAGDRAPLPVLAPASRASVTRLIRGRRSAQSFDGVTAVAAQRFFRMLDALLPRVGQPPWSLLDEVPCVHPVLFVHRVDGLDPGIYCLPRAPSALAELRAAMREDWLWARIPTARTTYHCTCWRRSICGSSPPRFPVIKISPPTPPLRWPCWRASMTSARRGPGSTDSVFGRRECSGKSSISRPKPLASRAPASAATSTTRCIARWNSTPCASRTSTISRSARP